MLNVFISGRFRLFNLSRQNSLSDRENTKYVTSFLLDISATFAI